MSLKAHRVDVTVTESHEVVVHLPRDFPVGAAQVVVLSRDTRAVDAIDAPDDAFARRFPMAGTMGPVVHHESPVAPIDEDDWPESMR